MLNKNLLKKLCLVLFVMSTSTAAVAHEFWLEPLNFKVNKGDNLQSHIKVGQGLEGDTYAYFVANFERFELMAAGEKQALKNRFAQKPAVDQPATTEGLHVLTYQSKPSELTYEKPEKFKKFLEAEGLTWVLKEHEKRGLPDAGFTELFKRFSKSLIKVGEGKGQDSLGDMRFEWVVLTNPYTDTSLKAVTAQLFFEGKPFPNSIVNVFIKRGEKVHEVQLKTDADGKVDVPAEGGGLFLVNAVHMVLPDESFKTINKPVWMSLWASTTFMID